MLNSILGTQCVHNEKTGLGYVETPTTSNAKKHVQTLPKAIRPQSKAMHESVSNRYHHHADYVPKHVYNRMPHVQTFPKVIRPQSKTKHEQVSNRTYHGDHGSKHSYYRTPHTIHIHDRRAHNTDHRYAHKNAYSTPAYHRNMAYIRPKYEKSSRKAIHTHHTTSYYSNACMHCSLHSHVSHRCPYRFRVDHHRYKWVVKTQSANLYGPKSV